MTSQRLGQAVDVFDRALERAPGERERFVATVCGDDVELRDRVLAMLRADAGASPLLDATPNDLASALVASGPPSPEGRRIGPYTILEMLGRGGMGVVYLARRDDVEKLVALKLVAGGLALPDRVARFIQERRVLAQLEHPHIARLLDAGVTDDGTPWLAMDYVPGQPIDVFCDSRRLTVDQRLSLFERVCGAVAYAHRHLVVHRDLKPANILVAEDGEPRLLDFGIAKLLADSAEGEQSLTLTGSIPLTPEYASPEQIRGEPITTASDVYQLGALLFELLTARHPHPERLPRFGSRTDVAVAKPSQIVSQESSRNFDAAGRPAPTVAAIAAARQTTPEGLRRRLVGDIDNIVLRATQLEPQRRYGTTEQLADDVRRHREGMPVLARPTTAAYRMSRFVRRHKAGTAFAAVAVLSLVGFGLAMAQQARRIEAQRVRAEQVSTLLSDLFASADPTVNQGDSVTVATLLDRGAERVRSGLTRDPEVKARLLEIMARAYRNLGQHGRSIELQSEAVAMMRVAYRPDHSTRLDAVSQLASWLAMEGHVGRADSLMNEVLPIARALPSSRRSDLAIVLVANGFVRQLANDGNVARRVYEEALAVFRTLPDTFGIAVEETLVNLGYVAQRSGDDRASETHWREVLDRRRKRLGPNHSLTAKTMLDLSGALVRLNKLDEAEQLVRDGVAIQRKVFRRPHSDVTGGALALARILGARGKYAEAEATQREALPMMRQVWGDSSQPVAMGTANLAGYVQRQGRLDEAEQLHREALQWYVKSVGQRTVPTAIVMTNLAFNAYLRRRLDQSDSIYRKALPILDSAWQGTSSISKTLIDFATVLEARGKCAEGEAHARRALVLLLREKATERALQPQRVLGICLGKLARYTEAESLLVDAHQQLLKSQGREHADTKRTAQDLVDLYALWGKPEKAREYQISIKGSS